MEQGASNPSPFSSSLLAKYELVCHKVHFGDGLHISQQMSQHDLPLLSLILPTNNVQQSLVRRRAACTDKNRMDAVLTDAEGNVCQHLMQSMKTKADF